MLNSFLQWRKFQKSEYIRGKGSSLPLTLLSCLQSLDNPQTSFKVYRGCPDFHRYIRPSFFSVRFVPGEITDSQACSFASCTLTCQCSVLPLRPFQEVFVPPLLPACASAANNFPPVASVNNVNSVPVEQH